MFGEDLSMVKQMVVALSAILALIGVIALLLKRFGSARLGGLGRGRQPRLAVIAIAPLDSRRKLVIVRRDAIEHLLMIGGPNDVLIEQGFSQPPALEAAKPIAKPQAPA